MKLDEGDIKIYYKAKGGSNLDLDDFFKLLLKLMGYQFYASGMDMETGARDLCFEKKEVKSDATNRTNRSKTTEAIASNSTNQ